MRTRSRPPIRGRGRDRDRVHRGTASCSARSPTWARSLRAVGLRLSGLVLLSARSQSADLSTPACTPAGAPNWGSLDWLRAGGLALAAAFLLLGFASHWWLAPIAVTFIGLGFYMLHNTLQTNATQMSPEARGTAVGLFSAALYLGETAGGRRDGTGHRPRRRAAGVHDGRALLAGLGGWFGWRLRRHNAHT